MTVKSNSGVIGPQKIVSKADAVGVHSVRNQILHRHYDEWPLKPAMVSLVPPGGVYICLEAQSLSLTLTTADVVDGTVVYWTINPGSPGVSAADFVNNTLTGTTTISGDTGQVNLGQFLQGDPTEGDEYFTVSVSWSNGGPAIITSAQFTLQDSVARTSSLQFRYCKYGSHLGVDPMVYGFNLDSNGVMQGSIFQIAGGGSSNSWQNSGPDNYSINPPPGYVCIVALRGNGWSSDFAIDYLIETNTGTSASTTYSWETGNEGWTTYSGGYSHNSSDITNAFNNRTNLGYTYLSWTRRSGNTPSSNTGPTNIGAYSGSYYIHTENSGGSTGYRHFLFSPQLN
tara:strand:+ start:1352 stop:2374 length:1023 start_codon:yes stop_codon:yes gene_type:complete